MTIRTRFAPSPTGFLHLGSARTALYCYLYAKSQKGSLILRVEDTDRERSTEEAVQVILDGLKWMALDYDEGPFYQTKRFDRYKEVITQLLKSNHAYRCYCSKDRLEKLRQDQTDQKIKPKYDGLCRDLNKNDLSQPHVIRFKNPQDGFVEINDVIKGDIKINNIELDDLIIARTDGTPTYNLTVVVDDVDMNITHVVRGDDHINNTPRQINILKALGAKLPVYAHMSMILGEDGKKLSKRHGAVSILEFQNDGILPIALNNYLVRLGWSHGDQEIFSMAEMIQLFDIKDLHKSPAAFNQDKLLWLNQHYMKTLDPKELVEPLKFQFNLLNIDLHNGPDLESLIIAQRERVKTLKEMAELSAYFYSDELIYDEKAVAKHLKPEIIPVLTELHNQFSSLSAWSEESIHGVIDSVASSVELKMGKLAQPLRVAVTGNTISPGISTTLSLIGQERVLKRLKAKIA